MFVFSGAFGVCVCGGGIPQEVNAKRVNTHAPGVIKDTAAKSLLTPSVFIRLSRRSHFSPVAGQMVNSYNPPPMTDEKMTAKEPVQRETV